MKNTQGFSLLEIIISLFVITLITSIIALVSINQYRMRTSVQIKIQSTNDYSRVVRELSHPDIVGKLLGFKELNADGTWIENTSPSSLHKCFSGKGTDCISAGPTVWTPFSPSFTNYNINYSLRNGSNCGDPSNPCDYGIVVNYKFNCEETLCYSVSFQIVQKHFDLTRAEKSVEIQHSSYSFLNKQEIDYSCAGTSGVISQIDFKNKKAICSTAMVGSFSITSQRSEQLYYPQPGHDCYGVSPCEANVLSEVSADAMSSLGISSGTPLINR